MVSDTVLVTQHLRTELFLDPARVKAHWEDLARRHGSNLQATTKTPTIKRLEVDALVRAIEATPLARREAWKALEVGCGNGHNCLELARAFPGLEVTGIDFVDEMVEAATAAAGADAAVGERVRFLTGDVTSLDGVPGLDAEYPLVFTVRCLINLASLEEQQRAISALAGRVAAGGYLLLAENSRQTHAKQNEARVALGLEPRAPAAFNHFFDDDALLPWLREQLDVVAVEDFASLHDLVLYVLVPSVNGGEVDYDHPLVQAATQLCLDASRRTPGPFGAFGQNRLYVCRKRAGDLQP